MRLIIDIPEERYANIKEEQWMPNRLLIEKAIANGIPLEQIRAEIEQIKPYELPWDKRTPEHIRDMAVEIVEKYAEQECEDAVSRELEIKKLKEQPAKVYIDKTDYQRGYIDGVNQMVKELKGERQKPIECEDAVSRQAVIEIIDGWYEQNRDTENIEDLVVLITYMDSVRPQEPKTGHWIPVSERLPEKTGLHLVSIGDLVTTANFDGHNFRTQGMIRFIPDAWMPLPNPYEPQESEVSNADSD